MEFSKNNKPCSIFLDLFFQILKLRSSKSEPISVSFEKACSIPLPEKVSDSISYKCSDNGEHNHISELQESEFPEKSSDYEHNLLTRNEYSNNGKRFNNATCKGNKIIPISKKMNLFLHPPYKLLDEWRLEYSNRRECQYNTDKDNIENLKKNMENLTNEFVLHNYRDLVIWIIKYFVISSS